MGTIYLKNNFIHASYRGLAKDLMWFLSLHENYDDGQGRKYDILDSELEEGEEEENSDCCDSKIINGRCADCKENV